MCPNQDVIMHYGVKGMKWGVRRYQNENGTLTNAGKKRYRQQLVTDYYNASYGNSSKRAKSAYKKLQTDPDVVASARKLNKTAKKVNDRYSDYLSATKKEKTSDRRNRVVGKASKKHTKEADKLRSEAWKEAHRLLGKYGKETLSDSEALNHKTLKWMKHNTVQNVLATRITELALSQTSNKQQTKEYNDLLKKQAPIRRNGGDKHGM